MGFRSASAVVGISVTATCPAPAGVASGDRLFALVNSDGFNAVASTGWTSEYVINVFADNQNVQLLSKTAGGSEPSSYVFTNVAVGAIVIIAIDNSTAGALTLALPAVDSTLLNSPISPAVPGPTVPNTGDTVVWFAGLDQNTDEAWASSGPSGFTTRVQGNPAGEFSSICIATLDNATAGAMGTLTGSFTGGAGQAGWGGAAFSVPSAGAPPPAAPSNLMMLGVG